MFCWEKAPGRAAPHRRPDWGCTEPPNSNSNPNPSIHQIIGFWRSAAEAAACKYWSTEEPAKTSGRQDL